MSASVYLVALLILQVDSGMVRHDKPLKGRVALSLSADRPAYYIKEAIRLVATLRNMDVKRVRGNFSMNPADGNLEIYYRAGSGPFSRFSYGRDPVREQELKFVSPRSLNPDEELAWEGVVGFDVPRRRFVLETPGRYEFRAVYRDVPDDANALLESDILQIDVLAPPSADASALSQYADEQVALVAQFDDTHFNPITSEAFERADAFLRQHPSSIYAKHIRRGLLNALEAHVMRNRATQKQKDLYDKLKAEAPEP